MLKPMVKLGELWKVHQHAHTHFAARVGCLRLITGAEAAAPPPPHSDVGVYGDLYGYGPAPWPDRLEAELQKKNNGKNKQAWLKYMRQIHKSQGFDIEDFPRGYKSAPVVPYHRDGDDDDEWLNDQCKKSLAKFNSLNESCYQFVKVEKANLRHCGGFEKANPRPFGGVPCGGFVSFLTFQAREPRADSIVTFQACYYDASNPNNSEVQFCGLKRGPSSKPNSNVQAPPSPCPVEDDDSEEYPPNSFTLMLRRFMNKGYTVENGPPERRLFIDGFEQWSASDADSEEEVLRRTMDAPSVVGALEFYPSLYREYKGKGAYMGPTEEEVRRRDRKLQRNPDYVVPGLIVLIVGSGVDKETNEPIYRVLNSWGVQWAENGFGYINRSLFYEFFSANGARVESTMRA